MVRKVILKNFESHEDSEIEFTEGLNLLIGQSNQGKSSIVRAIGLVVANQFDKEQVRTGKDFCEITVETDKGYVKARRGESVNQWETCRENESPKTYKNIGTGVPPEAMDILGMGEVSHGDVTELPNIMFQYEKHYMLSEINGKKATSNMIARMMDDAIGIGGMEELIKSMADDLASEKKSFNQIGSEISDVKSQLIDDVIFADYEKIIEKAEKLLLEYEEDVRLLSDSEDISKRHRTLTERTVFLERGIVLSEGLLKAWGSFEGKMGKLENILKAVELKEKLERTNDFLELSKAILEKQESLKNKISRLNDFNCLMNIKLKLDSDLTDDMELILKKFKELSELTERVDLMNSQLSDARKLYVDIQKAGKELESMETRMNDSQERLSELKSKLGVCPLCGAELK